MRLILSVWFLVLMILSGCSQNSEESLKEFVPPEDMAQVTNYISLLRQGRIGDIQKYMDPSMRDAATHNMLAKMAAQIPRQNPISVKIVGANRSKSEGIYTSSLVFEYQFPTNWILINVILHRKAGVATLADMDVRPVPDSLEHSNRFSLARKSAFQYLIFALAILIPIFISYALFLCIMTKITKRKWLWIIFILLGFGRITMNWTTGHWYFDPLNVQLFGTGAVAPLFSPWLITVSVPVGAIIFLLRRKKLTASPETETSSV